MKIVGIDGGGTKTEMVLCDEYGHVLKRVVGGPSSPTSQPVDRAIANIRDTLETLLKDFGGLHGKIDSLFAGISGGSVGNNSAMLKKEFEQMLPCCTVMNNGSDAVNALPMAMRSLPLPVPDPVCLQMLAVKCIKSAVGDIF